MGQSESSSSSSSTNRNIVKSDNWVPLEKCNESVNFNLNKFSEGRFRTVHMGTWVRPKSKEGQQCVVKHLKSSYTWKQTDWDTTERIYKEAKELANQFNSFTKTQKPIIFTDVSVLRCQETDHTTAAPRLNEYIIVEDFIPGQYVKWCNNYGSWSPGNAQNIQAFVHWSWYHSRGKKMVADLQGVSYSNKYVLTDPAILSLTPEEYGCTDMGPEGMALMLLTHTYNSICKHLPKPTEQDLITFLTWEELTKCQQALYSLRNNSTTYTWELKLGDNFRSRLAAELQEIATKHNTPYRSLVG